MPPHPESAPADAGNRKPAAAGFALDPARTALLVMHYQTDIMALFPAVAPTLLAKTRALCEGGAAQGRRRVFRPDRLRPGLPGSQSAEQERAGHQAAGPVRGRRNFPGTRQAADEPLILAHRASVFFGTDLELRLSAAGVDTLVMAGIASTGVMLSSIAYASDADFRLYTVKDCCYDPDPVVHEHLFATAFESRSTVLSQAEALSLLA
ncbi:cysteine hydrolase [Achromobacter denitrificans]|nr:cysteine hydrolase [Achromobacter denitrificans]